MIRIQSFTLLIFGLLIVNSNTCEAQNKVKTPEEKQLLKEANTAFLMSHFDNALPILLKLHAIDSTNSNYNFAIGISYLNGASNPGESIRYLNKTADDTSSELYHYVHYYLGEAYQLTGRCDDATTSFEKYKTSLKSDSPNIKYVDSLIASCKESVSPPAIYDSIADQKLDEELSSLVDNARISSMETIAPVAPSDNLPDSISSAETQAAISNTNATDDTISNTPASAPKEEPKTEPENKTDEEPNIATKEPESPDEPLLSKQKLPDTFYSVQTGNFQKPVKDGHFKDLKDLYQMELPDKIKYFSGVFNKKELAASYLKEIKEKGFQDAFVVHVTAGMKFIAINSFAEKEAGDQKGTGTYSVQLGSFKNNVPVKMAVQFMSVNGIILEKGADGVTHYSVGRFTERVKAEEVKKEMSNKGFKNAFVFEVPLKKEQ